MAQLFLNHNNDWLVAPLDEAAYRLACRNVPLLPAWAVADRENAPAILHRLADGRRWVLLARPGTDVFINGQSQFAGLRLLQHKDEILVNRSRFFFSTERLPQVQPFPALGREILCPRCQRPIETSTPAVCCPNCDTWCHSSEENPCWLYAQTCPICSQLTHADSFTWSPAQL
jgi:hypothetical protein